MKFNYELIPARDYDEKDCSDYVAFYYGIEHTDVKRGTYVPDKKSPFGFINTLMHPEPHTKKDIITLPDDFRIIPIIHQNDKDSKNVQRTIAVVFGSSGSGKTYLVNKICRVFRSSAPTSRMIYISSKNMPNDPSFERELFDFIPFREFIDYFTEEALEDFKTNNLWDNCLIVVDDILPANKDEKHRFYDFMGTVFKTKRMNKMDLIYITHEVTDYNYTRTLYGEISLYIFFPGQDIKNRSNRVLKDYFKLTKKEMDRIMDLDQNQSRYTCINTKSRCIITETKMWAIK